MAEELQAQQQICQHLRMEVEDLEEEMEQSQQKKREVGVNMDVLNFLYCTDSHSVHWVTAQHLGCLWFRDCFEYRKLSAESVDDTLFN